MPAAVPSAVTGVKLRHSTSESLSVGWVRPNCNGEAISHYNVNLGSNTLSTAGPETCFTVRDLRPDVAYNIRVQVR